MSSQSIVDLLSEKQPETKLEQADVLSETERRTYSLARKVFEGLALILMNLTIVGALFNFEMLRGDKSCLKQEYERVFLNKEIAIVTRPLPLSGLRTARNSPIHAPLNPTIVNETQPTDEAGRSDEKDLHSATSLSSTPYDNSIGSTIEQNMTAKPDDLSGNPRKSEGYSNINLFHQNALTDEAESATGDEKLRQVLSTHGKIKADHIKTVIDIVNSIISYSTIFGQSIIYDEQGMAYIRKNDKLPCTLQVYTDGTQRSVYIHFKSKKTGQQDQIGEACQKKVYRTINHLGEFYASSVIREVFKDNNSVTFETEKKALEIFNGCSYILQGAHASSYPNKDAAKGVKYGLITEYCDGTTDVEFFNTLSLKERWTFFLHTLEGVKAMHDRGYCHFDLKSDNILYKTVAGVPEPRIIDFGVMHEMQETLTHGARGACLPPELRIHESFPVKVTEKVDVWALGYYAAINILKIPLDVEYEYILDENQHYLGKKGKLNADWSKVANELQPFVAIIAQMLNCDSSERISMDAAIAQTRRAIEVL